MSITDLEKRLEALDDDDAKHEHMEYRQRGNVLNEGDDTTKQDLIEELGKQLSEYGKQTKTFLAIHVPHITVRHHAPPQEDREHGLTILWQTIFC